MTHDVNSRRRHFWTMAAAAICTAALTTMAAGQTTPTFEAASIKPNRSGDLRSQLGGPPGRFVGTNVTLRALILWSYQLQGFQLVGGPEWLDSDRFDVLATTASAVPDNPFAPG